MRWGRRRRCAGCRSRACAGGVPPTPPRPSSEGRTPMTETTFLTAKELMALLEERAISSRELLEQFLERIGRHNEPINAFVTIDAERALDAARTADAERARGSVRGPLHGLPM